MNSFTRLVSASREMVVCELSHEDAPGKFTIFGKLSFNRLTADISVKWCFECPLPLVVRIKEIFKFLKICGQL